MLFHRLGLEWTDFLTGFRCENSDLWLFWFVRVGLFFVCLCICFNRQWLEIRGM